MEGGGVSDVPSGQYDDDDGDGDGEEDDVATAATAVTDDDDSDVVHILASSSLSCASTSRELISSGRNTESSHPWSCVLSAVRSLIQS